MMLCEISDEMKPGSTTCLLEGSRFIDLSSSRKGASSSSIR